MNIYILVEVTYDYYRFQANIAAQVDNPDFSHIEIKEGMKILRYKADGKKQKVLDHRERAHYWLQVFENG